MSLSSLGGPATSSRKALGDSMSTGADLILGLKSIEQALAAGRLRIEQWLTIAEHLPSIALGIAAELETTMGGVRERLHEEQGVDAKYVVRAIEAMHHASRCPAIQLPESRHDGGDQPI
jgi:tape measure domain-containing protein